MSNAHHPEHAPLPKEAMPPLRARAPRPAVVRLRRGVVVAVGLAAAALCSGALAWAFIIRPELRAQSLEEAQESVELARGQVRPSEKITEGPASYAEVDRVADRSAGKAEPAQPEPEPPKAGAPASPARPTTPAAVDEARRSDLFFTRTAGPAPAGDRESGAAGPDADYAAVYNTHALLEPLSPYELKAGAIIPAVLLTGVDTARAGPVVASVTENTYDTISGRHLVIPQGSRLFGRHDGESAHGDRRAFITWERLILPNGKSLVLAKEPGVDAEGAIGLEGRVDRRILPLGIATLFAGAITALGEIARDDGDSSGGWFGDAGDAASIEAAQVGGRLIDRELQVRPAIRLRPGARVAVLVTKDLILEPYQP